MSALAMILTAAMMVPGDGPEKVSGEVIRKSDPLNLKGEWKASLYWRGQANNAEASVVDLDQLAQRNRAKAIRVAVRNNNTVSTAWYQPTDEGGGKLRMGRLLGIYDQEGDRLCICVNTLVNKGRPTAFRVGEKQLLFILHRVKSRK